MKGTTSLLIVGCLGLVFATSTCFAQMYTITDLGDLPGYPYTRAYGVNNKSQVVGFASDESGATAVLFLWENGVMNTVGPLGADVALIRLNDRGQIVGQALDRSATVISWPSKAITSIGNPGIFSVANDINDAGQVAGYYRTTSGVDQAFVWDSSSGMVDLGSLGGTALDWSDGYAINNLGQIVGESSSGGGAQFRAVSWQNGTIQNLGTLGGTSTAIDINDAGQVVGFSSIPNGYYRAFLYENGTMKNLGTLTGFLSSVAYGINNDRLVVGFALDNSWPIGHGFLYDKGVMTDLNELIPSDLGWELLNAFGINDKGQIVGGGRIGSAYHAYLLTPVVPYKAFVQPPINADGSSIFKANRGVVPVKFTLTENDAPTCTLPPATISVTRTAGGTLGAVDPSTYVTAADDASNFKIDPTACQYIYNLATRSLGVGTYQVDISINGIAVGHAVFSIQ